MRRATRLSLAMGFVLVAGLAVHEAVSLPSSPTAAISSYVAHEEAQSLHRIHGTVGATSPNTDQPHESVITDVHWDRTGLGYRPLDMKVVVEHHRVLHGLISWWSIPRGGSA